MASERTIVLEPGAVTMAQVGEIFFHGRAAVMAPSALPAVEAAARCVAEAAQGEDAVYGVNTGFGKLAQTRIAAGDLQDLQRNLILSHCCGVGPALPRATVRFAMALKIASLGRGASGVRPELIALFEAMLARDVTPVVPQQGSVGASGDLAPLAHIAAVMIGEGEADLGDGRRLPGAEALAAAGLAPVTLGAKEGLALINGTQCSTALALIGLMRARRLLATALIAGALSVDAALASDDPFRREIHDLRGHRGQCDVAAVLRALVEGSGIRASHEDCGKVQDAYSLRCQPQVVGACLDLLRQASATLLIEANAVTDNPLVLADSGEILSGGNFHAEPVAFAADQIALVLAELGSLSERRTALLLDPAMSGLPAFLTPRPGVNSGFMIAQVTAAALVAENRLRAVPASTDTVPTSANQEDHVSMATHGARRLGDMAEALTSVLAIELLCAVQGVELRLPLRTSEPLQRAVGTVRERVPALENDRFMAPDIAAVAGLVSEGALAAAVGEDVLAPLAGIPTWT